MPVELRLGLGEQARQIDSRMIFSPDRSVMYVAVPKTGCTTIKMVVAASVGLLDPESLDRVTRGGIHKTWIGRKVSWNDLIDKKREALLTSDSAFRFTSVRNPYERIVSCYLSKVVNKGGWFYVANLVQEHGEVSLLKFLEFVGAQAPLDRDVHCRAMTDLCFSGRVFYHDIIRYETFEADLRRVMDRLNVPSLSIPRPARSSKTEAGTHVHALLGPRECELVREIYGSDFKEFGYSLDLP